MSDKNVHSNINHAVEIIKLAKSKAKNVFIHLITDGRDCGPYESINYNKDFEKLSVEELKPWLVGQFDRFICTHST